MPRITTKPLRSVMFVPGNKEDWMRKAPQYGPDALILDLEDSVPEYDKDAARPVVARMIDELSERGQTLFVRVNRLETGLTGFDLEAVTRPGLYGILLPKVESPADVVEGGYVLLRFVERRREWNWKDRCMTRRVGNRLGHPHGLRHRDGVGPRGPHGRQRRQGRRHRKKRRLPLDPGGSGDSVSTEQGAH